MKPTRFISTFIFLAITAYSAQTQAASESYGSATDGTPLTWDVKMPNGKTKAPWILSIGSGHWVDENGVPPDAVQKIMNAGWASVHVFHRIAPPNKSVGQVGDGPCPEQADDVTMAAEAARKDARCDGRIAAIGGSGGANLTLVLQAKGKVFCAVGFSPATDLQALVAGGGQPALKALNYATNNQARINASPISYLQSGVSVPGMSVFFTTDQMPDRQRTIWNAKKTAIHVENKTNHLPGTGQSWSPDHTAN